MRLRTIGRVLFILMIGAQSLAAVPAPAKPLTNEDVVRMGMTGTTEKAVLAAIESRPVDFELSPHMVAELRQAGVGETIILAMQRRQAAMPKGTPPPVPPAPDEPMGTLRVEFAMDDSDKAPAKHSAIALKSLPKGMERRGGIEVGLMTDMALAILCITSDHVPDHWDTRTRLTGAPRHELLGFWPASATTKVKGHEILYLAHRPSYEIRLPEGPHNIVVAAAGLQTGPGTWRILESDGARVTLLPGRTTRVAVEAKSEIKGSAMIGFTVDSVWKIAAVQILDDAEATPVQGSPQGGVHP
jgi:hypothetical protein